MSFTIFLKTDNILKTYEWLLLGEILEISNKKGTDKPYCLVRNELSILESSEMNQQSLPLFFFFQERKLFIH